ncbi:MAG: cytochrome c [Planctomycetes bacterium]|nr:cytochrome c [Planctomycetota bacterium]
MPLMLLASGGGCAGPQPLRRAIDPCDEDAYVAQLNAANADAQAAYVTWMSAERGLPPDEVRQRDTQISQTRNPFDAHHDPRAVSRGAVLYKMHCARCHGDDARGQGPSVLPDHPATNFKTFGKRLAATLHRGAPRRWFRVLRDGAGDPVVYPEGGMSAMPAFGALLTREQMWLVITYLQSLDMHLGRGEKPR